jgi:two-component system chemotaxis response regulator CheB
MDTEKNQKMRGEAQRAVRLPPSYKTVVMGASAGGYEALKAIISILPQNFRPPILVAQHLHPNDKGQFAQQLSEISLLTVISPCDKERIDPGRIYVAPANYHMLMERGDTIALSVDERVNWSRPSIDVLFESAAAARGKTVIAVILSGANSDGAKGICAIKAAGGMTIAQDPTGPGQPEMPKAAIDTGAVDEVLSLEAIGHRLIQLAAQSNARRVSYGPIKL